ncbi:competence protein ComK [Bacillus sp. J33]|uniref:competence protein ComK n=1 Tax=Bacillus sp. J33 TaxID=935836 RepID=UPI00047CD332|nr:competence protein ComK [Bacillus sp. J33]
MVGSIKEKFVITRNTMAVLPEVPTIGNYSKIIEVGQSFCIESSPYDVLNESLLHYCSDLKGSIQGTKAILGTVRNPPIRMNADPDMYWLPHKPPYQPDCVWIALHHIEALNYLSYSETRVIFTNEQSIDLDISLRHLQSIIDLAEVLRFKMEKTLNRTRSFILDSEHGIKLISEEYNKYRKKDL